MSRKSRFIKLTEEEREALDLGFRTGTSAVFRQRCHYILLSDQGHKIKDIVATYRICRQSVAKWFDKYESLGIKGLMTKEGQGNKPILRLDNETHVQMVKKLVERHPQNLDPVLTDLEAKLGKSLSRRTLTRFLKKLAIAGNVSDASQ